MPLLHRTITPADPLPAATGGTPLASPSRRVEPRRLALRVFCESLPEADGATGVGASLVHELALELGDHPGLCIALAPPATNPIASRQADWALRGSVRRVHGELRTLVHLVRTDDHDRCGATVFSTRRRPVRRPRISRAGSHSMSPARSLLARPEESVDALPQPDPDRPGEFYDCFIVDTFRVKDGLLAEHWSRINKVAPPRHPG